MLAGILFDVDGSIMPQGGPIDPCIGAIIHDIKSLGIPMGPATGKNADYCRGLGAGIGVHWNYISAESGGEFLELVSPGPPPIWRHHAARKTGKSQLTLFAQLIQLEPLERTFLFRNNRIRYRPEMKQTVLSFFPPDENLDQTIAWAEYFEDVTKTYHLNLQIKRYGDGCVDVVPDGLNKRLGTKNVCRLLNCQPVDLLTVVDGANDHELAEGTTVIAVANASEDIKKIARRQDGYIATREDGYGFVEGLVHFSHTGQLPQKVEQIVSKRLPSIDPILRLTNPA